MYRMGVLKRNSLLLILVLGALLLRLAVGYLLWGSRDITIQVHSSQVINAGGSAWTSKLPIGYYLPALMQLLAHKTGLPEHVAQKLPAIAGDLLVAVLLWSLARRIRHGRPWVWPAVFLFNPVAVILSAYHGNVDPLMAAAMLWALLLRHSQQNASSGVALGLGVLMKPTAIFAAPALALPLKGGGIRAGIAMVVTVVATCFPFAYFDSEFGRFLSGYGGPYGSWGFPLILRQLDQNLGSHMPGSVATIFRIANEALAAHGRLMLLAILAMWSLYLMNWCDLSSPRARAAAVAATFLLFYLFAPGWGPQYLSLCLPFLLIASTRLTLAFSAAVTPYLLATYAYEVVFDKYAGGRVVGRLGSIPRQDLALLLAERGLSLAAWAACAYVFWRLVREYLVERTTPRFEADVSFRASSQSIE